MSAWQVDQLLGRADEELDGRRQWEYQRDGRLGICFDSKDRVQYIIR